LGGRVESASGIQFEAISDEENSASTRFDTKTSVVSNHLDQHTLESLHDIVYHVAESSTDYHNLAVQLEIQAGMENFFHRT
jgi:3-dehydroquinate dehydratase